MVKDGVFDLEVDTSNYIGESSSNKQEGSTTINRTVQSILVDDKLLFTAVGHPKSHDGHQ
jgi:hypothetical protein